MNLLQEHVGTHEEGGMRKTAHVCPPSIIEKIFNSLELRCGVIGDTSTVASLGKLQG